MERGKSVLRTLGRPGRRLRRKIAVTGFICRFILFLIFNPVFLLRARIAPDIWPRRKAAAIRLGCFFFPFRVEGHQAAPSPRGQIYIINHPTLNDPLCTIFYALRLYPAREMIVPVNLPWYEAISRYRSRLLNIGVNIVPILTPATVKRLGPDSNVSELQYALINHYTAIFRANMSGGEGLAVVAQQATRQRHLFADRAQAETGDDILSTISLILVGLRRAKILDRIDFVPIGVIPPDIRIKQKLNPFRKYTLRVGGPILAAELAAAKNAAKRPADLHMLRELARLLPPEYHFDAN